MIDRFKVHVHGFTADGDAVQHNFGFFKGERVSFGGFGVVDLL